MLATLLAYLGYNNLHRSPIARNPHSTVDLCRMRSGKGFEPLTTRHFCECVTPFSYPMEVGGSQIQSWPGFCRGSPYRLGQIGLVVNLEANPAKLGGSNLCLIPYRLGQIGLVVNFLPLARHSELRSLPIGSNRTCCKHYSIQLFNP